MNFDAASVALIAPLLIVVGMGCVLLVAETFIETGGQRQGLAYLGVATCVAALIAITAQWTDAASAKPVFQRMMVVDHMSLLLDATFLATAAVTFLLAGPYLREHGFEFGEFYAIILFTTAGMMMVAHATHLLTLLIGIETMSIGAYALTGCWRRNVRSSEGAMKYFLVGAFATGFLVYGMALIYGTTGGQLVYAEIASHTAQAAQTPLFLFGFYLLLAALIFKVAAVPFHMWAPDAYEGAPTVVTGFMAAGVKAAAFGGLLRILTEAFNDKSLATSGAGWVYVLSVVAILSMILGNLAAVRQENVKRLLAYSSIAHAGYLLIGVAAVGLGVDGAKPAVLFYLISYTFTTLGTFGVVAWAGRRGDERLFIEDWSGMGPARPGVGLAMTVFLLSLGGVPPTGGFFAKFYLFRAAMEQPALVPLVIVGVLTSVVSVYYYLRIVVAMYFREPVRPHQTFASPAMRMALVITAFAVLALGVLPGSVIDWAGGAAAAVAKVAGL